VSLDDGWGELVLDLYACMWLGTWEIHISNFWYTLPLMSLYVT
jgi:hypothetical protein